MNIAENLARTAATHPGAVALRAGDETLTFAQLSAQAAACTGWLAAQGVGPGDRVVLSAPNVPGFAVVYYAVLRLGGVVVPMNPLLKEREAAHYAADSQAALVVGVTPDAARGAAEAGTRFVALTDLPGLVAEAGAGPVHDAAPRDGEDTAVILYTSGTTGRPKGAELTHANLGTNLDTSAFDITEITPDDVVMGCLPLFHVFGMTCALNTAVRVGACLTLVPRFEPATALRVLEEHGVTVFMGVPTMFAALLAASDARAAAGEPPADLTGLRLCVTGGASMPVEILRAFEARFGAIVLEGYGLSETSPVASFNMPHLERRPGTVGVPVPGVEMAIVDALDEPLGDEQVGEIVVRGPNVMKGYWRNEEATATAMRGDWFHTGDLGVRDADGYYRIVDRTKDMIVRGGYNVYPREVEELLYEHPGVAEVAVVGVPDEYLGEEVVAYVARKPGATVTADELREFTKERIAAYKYPREVRLVDALPKGATGKILKRELPR